MQTDTQDRKREELLAGLAIHTGSEQVFRHWTRRFAYTEGVQYLAEKAAAYWLIDLVASWCPHETIRDEEFVVWKLTVREDRTAVATADNGNGRKLVSQEIPFTDFPLNEITLYLTNGVLLLPSEY